MNSAITKTNVAYQINGEHDIHSSILIHMIEIFIQYAAYECLYSNPSIHVMLHLCL